MMWIIGQLSFLPRGVEKAINVAVIMIGIHAVLVGFQFVDRDNKAFSVVCHFLLLPIVFKYY
jgi:hypothetical protein